MNMAENVIKRKVTHIASAEAKRWSENQSAWGRAAQHGGEGHEKIFSMPYPFVVN